MGQPVKLYVYDLSNGLARTMSMQLTGRQIDGIWHTSVVVFGKETFYGQGICMTAPGKSHHGAPGQIIDVGETELDEETFDEYINELREHYTADKYHLLEFNCNSFTNDVVGFLTGGSIPAFIKDLPQDFLSTPFGAALRPTIDAMYRRPVPGAAPVPTPATAATPGGLNPQMASSLLQAVASQASSGASAYPTPSPSSPPTPAPVQALTSSLHVSTNSASFHSLLNTHRVVVANFTAPRTCGPCRVVEPVFEELSKSKAREGVAFAKIDLDMGNVVHSLAAEYGVRATPTFLFFLDGKKTGELRGANVPELRTQIDLLLFEAFPPHPHRKLHLRKVESISLAPILFTQTPPWDTVLTKFTSFIDASPQAATLAPAKATITNVVLPYLKLRSDKEKASSPAASAYPGLPALLVSWTQATMALAQALGPAELFPLVDMWRVALLDPAASGWVATSSSAELQPLARFLDIASSSQDVARNFTLTTLRMLANAFSNLALARRLVLGKKDKEHVSRVLVQALLSADAPVRTAAASVAFNVAAFLQKGRNASDSTAAAAATVDDGDWEVELISAIVEAIQKEEASEEVVHRLVASLALLLLCSPFYESHAAPLLEVLQTKETLKVKAGGRMISKKDVKALMFEVADQLCA